MNQTILYIAPRFKGIAEEAVLKAKI